MSDNEAPKPILGSVTPLQAPAYSRYWKEQCHKARWERDQSRAETDRLRAALAKIIEGYKGPDNSHTEWRADQCVAIAREAIGQGARIDGDKV